MRNRYKFLDTEGCIYFMTMTVIENIPVFTNQRYASILIDNLNFYREQQGLSIYYYVIMDNHLHMIASHPDDICKIIQSFKSYTAMVLLKALENDKRKWILHLMKTFKKNSKAHSRYQFWQEGSHPQLIQHIDVLKQKAEYIHANPVKRGLVREPEHWYYSSATNGTDMEHVFIVDEFEF